MRALLLSLLCACATTREASDLRDIEGRLVSCENTCRVNSGNAWCKARCAAVSQIECIDCGQVPRCAIDTSEADKSPW